MRIIAKSVLVFVVIALSACSYGDKYDGLLVQDGDGNIYHLVHRFGDVYFVKIQNKEEKRWSEEANKRLLEKVGETKD